MTKEEREELRRLAEAATKPHTWLPVEPYAPYRDARWTVLSGGNAIARINESGEPGRCEADARFIAAANPTTVLSILDALEAALVDANSYRVIRTLVEHDYQLRARFYEVLGMAEGELAKRKVNR